MCWILKNCTWNVRTNIFALWFIRNLPRISYSNVSVFDEMWMKTATPIFRNVVQSPQPMKENWCRTVLWTSRISLFAPHTKCSLVFLCATSGRTFWRTDEKGEHINRAHRKTHWQMLYLNTFMHRVYAKPKRKWSKQHTHSRAFDVVSLCSARISRLRNVMRCAASESKQGL